MEIITGRMPTEGSFGDMDMVRWIETRLGMQGTERDEVLDSAIKPLLPQEECTAFEVLELALQCTKTNPSERPSSREVCDQLLQVMKNRKTESQKINADLLA